MKHILNLLLILCPFIFFACQEDEEVAQSGGVGYLRLNVAASSEVTTKAYNAEQFQVIVTNTQTNEVAYQTEDASIPANEVTPIPLDAGTYKIEAKSYNYEGVEAIPGSDRPYYAGLTEGVVVTAGKSTDASVECKLANVKVTVNFSQELVSAFAGRTVSASVKGGNFTAETFTPEKSGAEHSTYFPIVDLVTTFSVNNPSNAAEPYTKEQEIKEVAGNTHYVITYQLELEGTGSFEVTYDPTYNQYNFTVPVNPGAAVGAMMTASAWDRLAYLKAENVSSSSGAGELKFQYRAASSDESAAWTDVETAVSPAVENKYTAMLTGLTAETEYEYRLVDSNGTEIQKGTNFTTGAADARTELHNGSFELWTTGSSDGKETIYPGSADEAGNTTSFWNTSNPGTSQGLATLVGGAVNPTTSVTSPVKEGTYAAQLKSTNKLNVFATASLYTGKFKGVSGMSANMEFGQPFTSRPIALHGYYQYTPQTMNHVDRMPEGVTLVKDETIDECSIFIALAKKSFTFNNSKEEEYIDYEGDDNIIAYGSLPSGAATSGDGYVEFTIPLKYKEANFGDQPTHIIIVCSASKYGDYMSGADNSTLYVDDFSLIYDGEPQIWDLSANN